MKNKKSVIAAVWIGAAFLLLGELPVILRIASLKIWVTPFCWTGYIFLLDSTLYQKRGSSLIQDRPLQALFTVPISAGLWLVFEGYNLLLKNWEYLNIPANPWVAYVGFLWSFGTILPALLETNDLLEYWGCFRNFPLKARTVPKKGLLFSSLLGLIFLVYPLVTATPYDFPPVWFGFIFLLEPVNYSLGGESLLKRLEKGDAQRLLTLLVSGGIMGFFWEFWNFWAGAKWVYHIPVPFEAKIFEMPLWGFLGFFPFAVEFYVMYHSVLLFFNRLRERWD